MSFLNEFTIRRMLFFLILVTLIGFYIRSWTRQEMIGYVLMSEDGSIDVRVHLVSDRGAVGIVVDRIVGAYRYNLHIEARRRIRHNIESHRKLPDMSSFWHAYKLMFPKCSYVDFFGFLYSRLSLPDGFRQVDGDQRTLALPEPLTYTHWIVAVPYWFLMLFLLWPLTRFLIGVRRTLQPLRGFAVNTDREEVRITRKFSSSMRKPAST